MQHLKKIILCLSILLLASSLCAQDYGDDIFIDSVDGGDNTISLVEVVGNNNQDYGALTLTPSANPSLSELLIILISDDEDGETAVPPDGFSAIGTGIVTEGTTNSVYAYYKEAGGSEPASYAWDADGGNRVVAGVLIRLSKTGGTWSIADNATSTDASASSVDTGSVTVGADQFLIAFWGGDDSTTVNTAPTDMTPRYTYSTSVSAACYTQDDASGATTKTLVWSGGTQTCTWAIVVGLI